MRLGALLLACCVIFGSGVVHAQDDKPILMGIDIEGEGNGLGLKVSRNGQYVMLMYMGKNNNGYSGVPVYRWSTNGPELIARSPDNVQYLPRGISNDGKTLFYNVSYLYGVGGVDHINLWSNGQTQSIRTFDELKNIYVSNSGADMTADGSMIVGQAVKYVNANSSYNQAAVFFADGRTHMLPVPRDLITNEPLRGDAAAVSANGGRVVGRAVNTSDREMPYVWDDIYAMPQEIGTGLIAYGSATSVSGDGRFVVGNGYKVSTPYDSAAFLWTDVDGMSFVDMPAGYNDTYALDVTNNGQVLGVSRIIENGTIKLSRGFLWKSGEGAQFLDDILQNQGTGMGEFIRLDEIISASDDGSIITGTGTTFDGRIIPFILGLSGDVPGISTPGEIENSVNDMPLAGQQSRSMLSNHMMQSLFIARNALSSFLVPSVGLGASADELNDITPGAGPSDFRGHLDAREASAYVIGSFGVGQGAEAGVDYDNHVYSGTAGILYKLNDEHIIGGGFLASHDKQNTYLGGNVTIKGYGLSGIYAYEPDMGMRFYAVASAMHLDMDTKRNYRSGSRVVQSRGKTDGFAYGGMVRLGYAMYPWRNDQWQIMPYVEGEWSRVELDAYREKRGPFPARISKQNGDSLIGRLGGQLTYYVNPDLTLRGRAAWGHRYSDTDSLGVSVANLSFQLPHAAGARNWAEIGGTALWMVNDRAMLSFDVTGVTGRTAEPRVNAMLGLSYKF